MNDAWGLKDQIRFIEDGWGWGGRSLSIFVDGFNGLADGLASDAGAPGKSLLTNIPDSGCWRILMGMGSPKKGICITGLVLMWAFWP